MKLSSNGAVTRKAGRSLITLCLLASLAACGGGGGGGGSTPTQKSSTATAGSGSTNTSTAPSTDTSNPATTAGTKSVSLSWTPPSARADGTALSMSELSGYKLYIVKESDPSQDKSQNISGGTTTSTQVSLATPGTYTLAITSLDQNGQESALSNSVTLTLN